MSTNVLLETHQSRSRRSSECLLTVSRRGNIVHFSYIGIFEDSDSEPDTYEFSYNELRRCVQELQSIEKAALETNTHIIWFFTQEDSLTIRLEKGPDSHDIHGFTRTQLFEAFGL